MSMCTGCGTKFYKGQRCSVLLPTGEVVVRVVCKDCAKRAHKVVPVRRSTICRLCAAGSEKEATICSGCANDMAHKAAMVALQPFIEKLQGYYVAFQADGHARAEGVEFVLDLLKGGRT